MESGLKIFEVRALHVSDVWLHIQAYTNKLERDFEVFEAGQKWDFQMTRQLCHTVYMMGGPKNPIKDVERFMPSPWDKKSKPKIAKTKQEIWDDYEKMKAAACQKTS